MQLLLTSLIAALLIVASASPTPRSGETDVVAAPSDASINVTKVWARETGTRRTSSAAYFKIENKGDQPLVITGASSDIAKSVMIHETRIAKDGVGRMMHVHHVTIPAGESLSFEPGGYHVMLIGLVRPLKRGDRFTLTLEAGDTRKNLDVLVMPITGPDWDR